MVFEKKKKLSVLDNQILDLEEYAKFHPGGRFTFNKNVGRDISKYFYGAYKLVNSPKEDLHNHSPSAMAIANSMIIGHLHG